MDQNVMQRYERWCAQPDLPVELREALASMKNQPELLNDCFYRDLEFGTAGLRGVLGAGCNRMNIYVVRRVSQAAAMYLRESGLPMRVAIGHDSRIHSDDFAREAARVFAANGVEVYLYPRLEPVPALSFATRKYGCGLGVCITASHNPAQYNGYKVYGADGCQLRPDGADVILEKMERLDLFEGARLADFDEAVRAEQIHWIPDSCIDEFVDAVLACRVGDGQGLEELKLVYTPLNGAGLECVRKLLARLGVQNCTVVPEQEKPDGHFPTCPYPNPEIREAMELGLRCCDRVKPDILIGTDPDCDRCGAAVPDGKGGYRLISGNEMGVLLLDFIARSRKAAGTLPERAVAVTTIVSTDMTEPVAAHYGVQLRRVLTGFKYIGELIGELEEKGETERFIFGFEESYGYLSGAHVRDKDGVNAVLLICEAAAWYAKKGMTLADAMDSLYETYGYYRNAQKSYTFPGESGMEQMAAVLQALRAAPPEQLAGRQVERYTDYSVTPTGLPKANVLEYGLDGGAKLIVRPSGTEPKLKIYLSCCEKTAGQAEKTMQALAEQADALALKK